MKRMTAMGSTLLACLLFGLVWMTPTNARDVAPAAPATAQAEEDPMAVLRAFEGEWHCEAEWAWGATMAGRNIYEPAFDGKHMRARTHVADDGGPEYLRYETLFSYNQTTGEYVYTTIAYDGSVETGVMELRDDGFHIDAEYPNPGGGSTKLRQFISRVDGDTYAWRVQMRNPAGEWVTVMDDQWERRDEEGASE